MFWRLLRQSFLEGRRRKISAGVTVCLAATLGMALATLSVGVGDRMAQELRAYGANIRVVPKGESLSLAGLGLNPLKGRETLAEDDLQLIKDIFWRNNIIGLAPFLNAETEVGGRCLPLVGTWFAREIELPDGDPFSVGVRTTSAHWALTGAPANFLIDSRGIVVERVDGALDHAALEIRLLPLARPDPS